MNDDLRARREQHLLYIRLGVSYAERVRRLTEEFDATEAAVKKDETRMDDWMEDVANTASFEQRSAFLLYQHRSQTEGLERLARTAALEREQAVRREAQLQDTLTEYRNATPEELGIDPAEYYRTLSNLGRQANAASRGARDWAGEERRTRQAISENVMDEFEARQSLGDIEEKADRLTLDVERAVTERKLIIGVDLDAALPGVEESRLIGADVTPKLDEEAAESIDVEGPDREADE